MKKFLPVLAVLVGLILSGCVGDNDMAIHISTLDQLQAMKDDLTADYILDNDIDAAATSGWNGGLGFEPVGSSDWPVALQFTGSFDGQGHKITNLYINRPDTYYVGLFGYVNAAKEFKDVGIEDCDITGQGNMGGFIGINFDSGSTISNCYTTGHISGTGAFSTGGLCGDNRGSVSNCYSTVAITISSSADDVVYVAGLLGFNEGNITRCYATGDIAIGAISGDVSGIGGLIGNMNAGDVSESYATGNITVDDISGYVVHTGSLIGQLGTPFAGGDCHISECYATGNITAGDALVGGFRWIGGLLGYVYKNSTVANSYAKGNIVIGNTNAKIQYIGGLIGQNNCAVSNCYSAGSITTGTAGQGITNIGGLIGYLYAATGTVSNSFWDTETSGLATSDGGTGKTTEEMKTKATFTGLSWNFTTVWNICEGIYIPSYPWLRWQGDVATMCSSRNSPWDEDILEPTGEAKVEIPAVEGQPARRSGNWITLPDVMRIHTSNGEDTSSPRAPIEIGQAELLCCNISKNFNSFEEASDWYKNLEGYATQISLGCNIGGSPISVRLFTGIIKTVHPHRLSQTAEIRVIDFLDYFGRVTIEETPVWENISLTQLFKNLVELAFTDWTHGVDYFVEDLGGSTIPAIGYTNLNLLSELKMIAASRGKRIYTDAYARLHCASRNPERDPLTVSYDYNLEKDVKERRNINTILNWIVVEATPYEILPDTTPPGKISAFTATPGDQKIDLTWNNPTDDDFEKVLIHFSTTAYPLNRDDGTQLYEGTGEAKEHTGLTNGTKYYYSAWTVDDKGNWSNAAHTAATPAAAAPDRETWEDDMPPSKVSMFQAEPYSQKIILTWYNPNIANFDKVVIRRSTTSYPDSPTSGALAYEGTAETHDDTGLANGTRYFYSAFAKNTAGLYSGAAFASAETPSLTRTRKLIQTQTVSGYGWLGPRLGAYGTSYRKKVLLAFRGLGGKYSTDWLRFKHEWDIKVNSGPSYSSNQKHVYGAADDLALGFTASIGGVAGVTVTKVRVTTSEVQVEYNLVYIGGKALSISFSNKLSLWG